MVAIDDDFDIDFYSALLNVDLSLKRRWFWPTIPSIPSTGTRFVLSFPSRCSAVILRNFLVVGSYNILGMNKAPHN